MAIQPPLALAHRFPFTAAIAIASIAISINWWMGGTWAEPLFIPHDALSRPWTFLASTLPHVNPMHLLFNLMWWWPLGALVEHVWGGPKAVGVFVVLAALSSAAEFAFLRGGVGLSGVVYGLATLLWVVQAHDHRFGRPITSQTMKLLGAWFLICVVLTITDVMPIGNIAHGAGALAGWLLGHAVAARTPQKRALWIAALALIAAGTGVGATVARRHVNFSHAFHDKGYLGAVALEEKRSTDAVPLLETATTEHPNDADLLINLGIAYTETGRPLDAAATYARAAQVDPSRRAELAPFIGDIYAAEAQKAGTAFDLERARELGKQALEWTPNDPYVSRLLSWVDGMERAMEPTSKEPR